MRRIKADRQAAQAQAAAEASTKFVQAEAQAEVKSNIQTAQAKVSTSAARPQAAVVASPVQAKSSPQEAQARASTVHDPLMGTVWRKAVPFFAEGRHCALLEAVAALRAGGASIYPAQQQLLRAFTLTDFDQVRVLILGQDPYHGAGQAHGLAFSVPTTVAVPRSLHNIRKELLADVYGGVLPPHWHTGQGLLAGCPAQARELNQLSGDLTPWARQGILLLNVVLSVEAGLAGSHAGLGWQALTKAALGALAERKKPLAVLLWGNWAKEYGELFLAANAAGRPAKEQHLVLVAAHPSPLSASRGFFGCGHGSQVNTWLRSRGEKPILW
jgi:uracil-DNA glycosylase